MTTPPQHTAVCVARIFSERLMIADVTGRRDIVEAGLLDSAGFMQLFVELEAEFDIHIHQSDLDLDNFRTLEAIVEFVEDLQARPATALDR